MTPPPRSVLAVGLGGAVGAGVRYLLGEALPSGSGGFPWTILAINVSGALLLALLPALGPVRRSATWTAGLGAGVLGGYTTLSTLSEQTRALLDAGSDATALAYLLGTLAAALVAVQLAQLATTPVERRAVAAERGDQ